MTLKEKAVTGAKWATVSSVVTTLLHLLQLSILARLLDPRDFGLMAMVMVVLGFAQAYADMGISNAIIHHQDIRSGQLSSLYWLNIIAGIFVFFLVYAAAPLIVRFYHEPRLSSLLPFAALIFLIIPFGQQFQILLEKELNFKLLSIIIITSSTAGFIIAVILAYLGAGVFSLIWGQVVRSSTKAIFLAIVGCRRWRPIFRFKRCDLKGYIGFGLYQMGEKSVHYLNTNLDKMLIGSLLGAETLGYYTLAWNLVIFPISKINPILTGVAFPVFARLQSDTQRLREGYLNILKLLTTVNFPLLVGLASVALVFIPTLFGPNWMPAVSIVQVLSFVALFRSQVNPIGSLLLAKGRADLGFQWNVMKSLIQLAAIYTSAKIGGIQGVIITLLILEMIYFYPFYRFLVKPMIDCSLGELCHAVGKALLFSLLMGGCVIVVPYAFNVKQIQLLCMQIVLGALIYITQYFIFDKAYVHKMTKFVYK